MKTVTLKAVTFPGYEAITDRYAIAAAVVVPANYLTLATSGHVGLDAEGNLADTVEEQIRLTFEVCYNQLRAATGQLVRPPCHISLTGQTLRRTLKNQFSPRHPH